MIDEFNPKGGQGINHEDEMKYCFADCNDKTDVQAFQFMEDSV